jgi:hypothetical protein
MKPVATFVTVLICLLLISAAAFDVHCGLARPAGDALIAVCRAGRMP